MADDQTALTVDKSNLSAQAPDQLRRLLEVRGIGIMTLPYRDRCALALLADLTSGPIDRLPSPDQDIIEGVSLPCLTINPFEISAPIKLKLALHHGFGVPA